MQHGWCVFTDMPKQPNGMPIYNQAGSWTVAWGKLVQLCTGPGYRLVRTLVRTHSVRATSGTLLDDRLPWFQSMLFKGKF